MRHTFRTIEDAMAYIRERIDPALDEALERQAADLHDAGASDAEIAAVARETCRRLKATEAEIARWLAEPDAVSTSEH